MTKARILRLGEAERRQLFARHPLWQPIAEREAIRRCLRFADFAEAFRFMSAVAAAAEAISHYPEWSNLHARVDILLTTHELEGLSQHDAALAQHIDELALLFGAETA